jgi:hypothetical protein
MVYAASMDFAMCAFVRFLSFADSSKTMLRKHTKSIQNESAVSLPDVLQGVSPDALAARPRARRDCLPRYDKPINRFSCQPSATAPVCCRLQLSIRLDGSGTIQGRE